MKDTRIAAQGLVLLGCGKMGSAMLAGWLARGLPPTSVWVVDPYPSDWLQAQGVHLNEDLPSEPAIVLVAVKPQMMADALPTLQAMGNGKTLFISVAAGTTIDYFEQTLGAKTPVVRAMPNTPAAISQGITAIVANSVAGKTALEEAELLLSAVGEVVRLEAEAQIDAVTGVSGSGPAYVFHMIEALAAAGEAQGLPAALAMQLAKATVAGAGALAMQAKETPSELRVNVTSPNGTTQAALEVLMDEAQGFPALMPRAVAAAADRSRELARG
ncbi:Pyrroline-5-carboxylate reductase [Sulfitobacter noctilucicola]|uniref:Pyrroline-5-carboxylate reductase n=1 Tax=Sulfitobacter noctilucicola TaxID=1342301 RepID=A0A7W6M6P4_9RHOB|nr:pyrroline-5-carboxylate reductase [Sulfitobacter noctilucicola]KIN62007.1 Pyrroline-5-carboxylate reductase [Sulfitobacter noctilucicola]MBB4173473.1 pyrroline-5-carboxylate reductase [Sulfitobacter noctilucicola]